MLNCFFIMVDYLDTYILVFCFQCHFRDQSTHMVTVLLPCHHRGFWYNQRCTCPTPHTQVSQLHPHGFFLALVAVLYHIFSIVDNCMSSKKVCHSLSSQYGQFHVSCFVSFNRKLKSVLTDQSFISYRFASAPVRRTDSKCCALRCSSTRFSVSWTATPAATACPTLLPSTWSHDL